MNEWPERDRRREIAWGFVIGVFSGVFLVAIVVAIDALP